ncbi:MAG: NADP-binding protein [Dehalococcoidia bacterium]|nr:NADP-binding protein [Dehalococcoidia bacterium]
MSSKYRVIQYGLGVMGSQMVQMMLGKRDLEVVAAISGSGRLAGSDLSRAIGLDNEIGIVISANADEVFRTVDADVVLHATTSWYEESFVQTREALRTGKNVITIAEEASHPWIEANAKTAREIDSIAKEHCVTFLGTGVNPGFMMDYLPITLTGVLKQVDRIRIRRVIDWSRYGPTLFEHICAGKSVEDFERARERGEVSFHVGLEHSLRLTAEALGWELDSYSETAEVRLTKSRRNTRYMVLEPGTVCGYNQAGHGFRQGKEVLTYEMAAIINPDLVEDGTDVGTYISIDGTPGAEITVGGEFAGQGGWGTVASAVNSIPRVIAARPGVVTVAELPPWPCLPQA